MDDIERIAERHPVVQLWLRPIEPFMSTAGKALDKPLAEVTPAELLAIITVFVYAAGTGMLIGQLAGNLALTVLRGPPRLR